MMNRLLALAILVGLAATGSSWGASATVPPPSSDKTRCTAMATRFYKANGHIHLTMKVDCPTPHAAVFLQAEVDRTGGGAPHRTWFGPNVTCKSDYGCARSYTLPDVRGRQHWWFLPSPDGTRVASGVLKDEQGEPYVVGGNCAGPQNGTGAIDCLQDNLYG